MAFSWRRANPFGALMLLKSHRELSGLASVNFLLHFSHHVFSAVWVLYAGSQFGLTPSQVGMLLAVAGGLDMVVQGLFVGPVTKRLGERATMILGLSGGAVGLAAMGFAPDTLWFALALLPNALWGLAMPTLQSLMTKLVSESEQGQLQGANMSVASIAGVASPLFFGWVYSATVAGDTALPFPGASFVIAAAILALGACLGWAVARRAMRAV